MLRYLWFAGLLAVLVSISGVPAGATQFRRGDTVTIGRDEVIDDDLFVAGQNLVVEGTVRGDLIAAANTARIPGHVQGNLLLMAQSAEIPGRVDGSVRVAARTATISGQVGRNLDVAAQNAMVASGSRVGRDVHAAGRTVTLEGQVAGPAFVSANTATANATIGGDLRFDGNTIKLGPETRVQGDLLVRSTRPADIAQGAVVAGVTRSLPAGARHPAAAAGFFARLGRNLLFALALFAAGAVGLALAPRYLRTASDMLRERPGWSALWGFILLIVVPFAAALLFFTLIGIPLGIAALGVWGLALLFCSIPVALFLGRQAAMWIRQGAAFSPYASLAIGLLLLAIAGTIPFLGGLVRLLVVVFGLGMFALAAARYAGQAAGPARPAAAA